MKRGIQLIAQAAIYAGFAFLLAYFSSQPPYERVPGGEALIKLSFAHGAERVGGCHKRTNAELMELAPNMRAPIDCPRQRLDVKVRMKLDDQMIYEASLPPTGLHSDGASITYQRIVVPSGSHVLELGLIDTDRVEGYDYVSKRQISLSPGQSLAIDFKPGSEGFIYE